MDMKHHGDSNVKRGDLVWVRVNFPHRWYPALVHRSNTLGLSLSFFNLNTTISPINKSSYFLHSQLIPFQQNFRTIISLRNNIKNCDDDDDGTFYALLDSALRLLGRRVIASLSCRCLMGLERQVFDDVSSDSRSCCFDSDGVLGFVLKAGVVPRVDVPDFVDAVGVVAQVHAFRRYCSVQQKRVYRETSQTGNNVKLHPCSSSDQKMHSVTQESVALEPEDEYQIIFKKGEKNMAFGAIRKRKPLDKPALSDCSSTRQRALSFSSINEVLASLQITKPGKNDISGVSISSSALANCLSSCNVMEMDLYKDFLSPSPVKLKIQNLKSNQGFTVTCTRGKNWMSLPCSAACNMPLLEDASCLIFPQGGRVQESEGSTYMSISTRPCISHFKMLEPEESVQKDNQACICFHKNAINFADEVQKVDLRKCQNLTLQQSFTCDSLSDVVPGFCSDICEVDASAAKIEVVLGCNSSVYHKRLRTRSNGDATAFMSKKQSRTKLSSKDCLVEDKDHYQHVTSCSILNSKVGQQSKTHVPFSFTSLYMKFPKNFNLPSKRTLIKKFSVFGSIDSTKTRVFNYTGSAQVAFLHEADAVAAHLYAKKKKVPFGNANIRFWLHPIVHKRKGFKRFALMSPSARKPIGPLLKSCLKNSRSLRQDDRKKHHRVRFAVET
ncbi:hypothetical protein RIF29_25298 [Crotalaria pallida]|uniref:PWWP domain-containing protein n=1 Tax=Crotalaria pallida TaxID=3830 RepID=A0AAN9ENI2_CROPI